MLSATVKYLGFTFFSFCGVAFIVMVFFDVRERGIQQRYCEKHNMFYQSGAHGPILCVFPQTGQAFEYFTFRKVNGD